MGRKKEHTELFELAIQQKLKNKSGLYSLKYGYYKLWALSCSGKALLCDPSLGFLLTMFAPS